ncbi:hypothetical protein DYH09_05015 [bacterium CPR1]|nr:hypothetical protein [bacterium CPR1]
MILEILTEDGSFLAFQAVAQVRMLDRRVSRALLGPMVRELLEHYLHVEVARKSEAQVVESLQTIRGQLRAQLERDLRRRGVELVEMTLRVIQLEAAPRDPDGFWLEVMSPEMLTVEGFVVTVDAVARVGGRSWFDATPEALRQRATLVLHEGFLNLPRVDLESLNRDRGCLAQQILSFAHPAMKAASVNVESLAITDIRVQPRTREPVGGR